MTLVIVVSKCVGELCIPLKHGIFPNSLKIAKITPAYKSSDSSSLSNYRPISVLPYFSKMLERVMYTRLYNYLHENEILYSKQFGFQKGQFTDHAIIQLGN